MTMPDSVLAWVTVPLSGFSSPVSSFSSVVLPVPLAPTRPIRSPRWMRRVKSLMIWPLAEAFDTCSASITVLVFTSSLASPSLAAPAGPSIAARWARISLSLASRPWLRRRRAVTPRCSQCSSSASLASSFSAARCFLGIDRLRSRPRTRRSRSRPGASLPRSSHRQLLVSRLRKVRSWLMTMNAPLKRLSQSSSQSIAPRSRWLVGSSSSSTSGSCASARTIAARRRSPPLAVLHVAGEVDADLVGDRRRLMRRGRVLAGQHPILERRMPAHDRVLLQQHDLGAGHDLARPLVGLDQPGEAFQQGRLARAVAADQRQPVARPDDDVEVAEQPAFALDQAEIFIGQNWGCHRAAP